jgi:2-polyprenyl-6-hydroxyphenyl methylase/3-demethylubiquinone-9 3-methyltransferase
LSPLADLSRAEAPLEAEPGHGLLSRHYAGFLSTFSRVLKAGGVFLYDTINRTLRSRIAVIGIFQQCAWTSCAPRNLHDWNKFIRPAELRRMILQCGLSPGGIAGLKPQSNPIDLIRQMRRRKRGEISYGELGRRMAMRKNDDVSMSYMGWAVKAHNMPVSYFPAQNHFCQKPTGD